ncbi:Fic family protein [Phascolarctobacterium succinatutens]|uniref:Fic family protein n=1 Tax=Phascolarctobacterium succinatutens TaxID=626940 RepID=UPI0026F05473|nr:Fic family protein [Phascolarctobacterium succinatutens]
MANSWYEDLNAYIRLGEPKLKKKAAAWKTAIGLQAVDGLSVSDYLLKTAKENIEGKITDNEANAQISNYYEDCCDRYGIEAGTKEADIVAGRIASLLAEKTFSFTPAFWMSVHRYLFKDVFMHAGKIRTYNIYKNEWVLNGKSVFYASYDSIPMTLDYDFNTEKRFSYRNLSESEIVKHIAKFTCDIWQIHPFCEGNTRSTAVFIIKYLNSLGYSIGNEAFAKDSWYFRNALVRANYNDLQNGVHATTVYLEKFFENLLYNGNNELKNRYLHIDWHEEK